MVLLDSRKCPGMPSGAKPKSIRRLGADVHELPRGQQHGTGIHHGWEVFQKKLIQHGQDIG